jgi:hypothetical protein|tara:strand:- start:107 stop:475 length:369 start_codon:yes stop_codon:yes gene_type:complete
MRMNESILQQQIVLYLEHKKLYYQFRYWHTPNEGKRKVWYLKKLKNMGMKSGVPDLILEFSQSKFVYLEIKMPKGRLSNAQKLWKVNSEILGTPFHVIKGTYEECKKQIDNIFIDYEYARIR